MKVSFFGVCFKAFSKRLSDLTGRDASPIHHILSFLQKSVTKSVSGIGMCEAGVLKGPTRIGKRQWRELLILEIYGSFMPCLLLLQRRPIQTL